MVKASQEFVRLIEIIERLTAPDGCPWDREQTPETVKKYILEEAYELVEAIDSEDTEEVCEEIGDLFFMLLFLAHMYQRKGHFEIHHCLQKSAQKMIRRHPHIFGQTSVRGTEDVVANWQAIKAEESKKKGKKHSALGNLPKAMPALQRAFRLGERASRVGFDWLKAEDVWEKIYEEQRELKEAIEGGDKEATREEIGDLLFTLANMARLLGVNPEEALQQSASKFVKRFHNMEEQASAAKADLTDLDQNFLEDLWNKAKVLEEKG